MKTSALKIMAIAFHLQWEHCLFKRCLFEKILCETDHCLLC